MGLPSPITDRAFMEHKLDILAAAVEESVERMNAMFNDDILDVTVTCNGTCAKWGFTSQFGVFHGSLMGV